MRVCLDLTPLYTRARYRGIGRYAYQLASAFRETEHRDLEITALIGAGETMRVVPIADPAAQRLAELGPPLGYTTAYAARRALLPRIMREARVALFHATDPRGVPPLDGCLSIVTCHDLIPTLLGPPYRLPCWPRWASAMVDARRYRSRDHVIAISRVTLQDLQRMTFIDSRRVTVIHHGVDRSRFRPRADPRDRAGVARALQTDRPYFLYVGAFDARKRVPALIRSFARCCHEIPEQLVIAGELKPLQRLGLERLCAALGVSDRVVLAGFLDHALLPALYSNATAHTLLSSYEGFGMTVLESFACGCPVLALRTSSVPEVAGDAALLLEPDGPDDDAAAALVQLSRDRGLGDDLRRRGLARAAAFTWQRCAERTLEVYRRAVGRG